MSNQTDITNKGGNDLWAALTSGKPFKAQAATKQNKLDALLTAKVQPFIDPWQDISTVLLVHIQRCTCGCSYESPNAIRFIKRKHKRLGSLHYRRLDELAIFEKKYNEELTAEIAYREETITACQRCFGLARMLQGHSIQHTQDVPILEAPQKPEYISSASVDYAPAETVTAIRPATVEAEILEVEDDLDEVSL